MRRLYCTAVILFAFFLGFDSHGVFPQRIPRIPPCARRTYLVSAMMGNLQVVCTFPMTIWKLGSQVEKCDVHYFSAIAPKRGVQETTKFECACNKDHAIRLFLYRDAVQKSIDDEMMANARDKMRTEIADENFSAFRFDCNLNNFFASDIKWAQNKATCQLGFASGWIGPALPFYGLNCSK